MKVYPLVAATTALAALAGCASKPAPTPQPRPLARPVAPPPRIQAPAVRSDWRDTPLTPGAWRYREQGGPEASFRSLADEPVFSLRCDRQRRLILLSAADASSQLTIRTSTETRAFASGKATLPASDRFLDAIAFSRGRFTVEAAGAAMLVIPAWPEPARVIEDCRA